MACRAGALAWQVIRPLGDSIEKIRGSGDKFRRALVKVEFS
jgi:hypothetical protein